MTPVLLLAGLLLCCACSRKADYIVISGYAQGGTYTVKLNRQGPSGRVRTAPEQIKQAVDSILYTIDTTLSGYNPSSLLSRFNAGERIPVNDMFLDIYREARALWEETGGALDVAAGGLFDLWGFGFTDDTLPPAERIRGLLDSVGMHTLAPGMEEVLAPGRTLSGCDLALREGLHPVLNYNAIAQGYSCDRVADYLHGIGVKDMLVDIGEIYCEGKNPSGRSWSIGIDRPVDGNNRLGADLDGIWQSGGKACGIVTSGNYRKYYIRNGKKYAHTIDPRTGYPVSHTLLSATIVAPDAMRADAYATYCMVIGLDSARVFIQEHPELEGYLIYDQDGEMREWASEGFTLADGVNR